MVCYCSSDFVEFVQTHGFPWMVGPNVIQISFRILLSNRVHVLTHFFLAHLQSHFVSDLRFVIVILVHYLEQRKLIFEVIFDVHLFAAQNLSWHAVDIQIVILVENVVGYQLLLFSTEDFLFHNGWILNRLKTISNPIFLLNSLV